jgi:hypothetical protein
LSAELISVAPHRIDNHVVKLVRSIKDVASVDNVLPLRMGYTIVGLPRPFAVTT